MTAANAFLETLELERTTYIFLWLKIFAQLSNNIRNYILMFYLYVNKYLA